MSHPFSVSRERDKVVIVQLSNGVEWNCQIKHTTTRIRITGEYYFRRDVFDLDEELGYLLYTQDSKTIPVRYLKRDTIPIVGASCCTNQWAGIKGVTIEDVDLMFHLGDLVYMDSLYHKWMRGWMKKEELLNLACRLYIDTFNHLGVSSHQHLYVPDDHDWVDDSVIKLTVTPRSREYYNIITPLIDLLYTIFNGQRRQKYYKVEREYNGIRYIAYSSWYPVSGVPQSLSVEQVIDDLTVTPSDRIVLMFSTTIVDVKSSGCLNKLVSGSSLSDRNEDYRRLAGLRDRISDLTVVCGDLHAPISYTVEMKGHSPFSLLSTGSVSNVVDRYHEDDFNKEPDSFITPLPELAHLDTANSYLLFEGTKSYRSTKKQSLLTSLKGGLLFLISATLELTWRMSPIEL